MSWTPELTATVTDMWRANYTAGEIAKQVGMSRNAVLGRLHRLGLTGNRALDPKVAAVHRHVHLDRERERSREARRLGLY